MFPRSKSSTHTHANTFKASSRSRAHLFFIFILLFALITLISNYETTPVYVECNGVYCINPFYQECEQNIVPCDRELLVNGEQFGNEPNVLGYCFEWLALLFTAIYIYIELKMRGKNGTKKNR